MAARLSPARRIFLKDGRLRPILRVIIYVSAVLLTVAALSLIIRAGLAVAFHGRVPKLRLAGVAIGESIFAFAIVAAALFLRHFLDRRSTASLGFPFRAPWLRLTAIGAGLGAGMQLLVFAADQGLGFSRVAAVSTLQVDLEWLPLYFGFFVVAALAEEMSIRGYLLQNFWEDWGFIPALATTSVLFALLHLGNPNSRAQLVLTLAGLLAYGIWASLSLLWTKSLWVALGAHAAWNLFEGPVLGFPVSGVAFSGAAMTQIVGGPHWFTGGRFGPEAGVGSTLALIVGLAALYALYRWGAFAAAGDLQEPYAREMWRPNARPRRLNAARRPQVGAERSER